MSMSDPIADMLTRIRNAQTAKHDKVDIPSSNTKLEIVKILKNEGFIKNFKLISNRKQGILRVYLKYTEEKMPIIHGLQRVSKPSRRWYSGTEEIPFVRGGLGVLILSTNKGIMTDEDARRARVGGELICEVW